MEQFSIPAGDKNELEELLVELNNTTQATEKLCQVCMLDYLVDPSQMESQEIIQDIETSDSYDTDDGDDMRYAAIRDRLKAFNNENARSVLRIGPVFQSRMRKDIRAWARIASYACIRLPGDMMLIHKEWVQRPRKPRRKRNTDLHGETMEEGAQTQGDYTCECCPKKPKKFDTEDGLRYFSSMCGFDLVPLVSDLYYLLILDRLHESEKPYACNYCPNRFKSKNEAERHENSLHRRRTSWSCGALLDIRAAMQTSSYVNADVCGYCGMEFPIPAQWEIRADHLKTFHKFGECNKAKKFFRADHFRQHLKHSHQGVLNYRWTSILEYACMMQEGNVDHATPYVEEGHTSTSITQPSGPVHFQHAQETNFEPTNPKSMGDFEKNIWQPRDTYTGYASDTHAGYASASSMSSASMVSTDSRAKKGRLPRDEDAYTCDFPGCDKIYDRQCDLRQHKRCHRPEDDLPYECDVCGKRCPFPKDLRRHMKIHGK